MVKHLPAMQETWVWSLGWEGPLEKTWLPTPVFLPGESPETEEPGRLQSMGSQRVGHNWAANTHTQTHTSVIKKLSVFPINTLRLIMAGHSFLLIIPLPWLGQRCHMKAQRALNQAWLNGCIHSWRKKGGGKKVGRTGSFQLVWH